ncbi:MAG: response regulator transcription factor [Elusimicrobiota bacterium]|jgi:two-component system phosphate regulon response regulator PhoB/two-component system alkaline phosphatase synthesis response regulator PhoP|nr:response regulator transcription factor [Elusimicrobiota bacterium]
MSGNKENVEGVFMQNLIVAVDDEEDILKGLAITLKKEGYNFKGFTGANDMFKFLKKSTPDFFILDIMLPDMNGFDISKELRKTKKFEYTPIIFLSAKSDEIDKLLGLELGADDYITKPFSLKELAVRIKVIFRRQIKHSKIQDNVNDKDISIDKEAMEVFAYRKKIDFTITEFKLFELLFKNKNKVFSRDSILNYLWGEDKIVTDRTIDLHIKNIREKLGKAGKFIKNIRTIGYKFEK